MANDAGSPGPNPTFVASFGQFGSLASPDNPKSSGLLGTASISAPALGSLFGSPAAPEAPAGGSGLFTSPAPSESTSLFASPSAPGSGSLFGGQALTEGGLGSGPDKHSPITRLLECMRNDDMDGVQELLQGPGLVASLHGPRAMRAAAGAGAVRAAKVLHAAWGPACELLGGSGSKHKPLLLAARSGHAAFVRWLLEALAPQLAAGGDGVDFKTQHAKALLAALASGQPATAAAVLEGAPAIVHDRAFLQGDAAHAAAAGGSGAALLFLTERVGTLNATAEGTCALSVSALQKIEFGGSLGAHLRARTSLLQRAWCAMSPTALVALLGGVEAQGAVAALALDMAPEGALPSAAPRTDRERSRASFGAACCVALAAACPLVAAAAAATGATVSPVAPWLDSGDTVWGVGTYDAGAGGEGASLGELSGAGAVWLLAQARWWTPPPHEPLALCNAVQAAVDAVATAVTAAHLRGGAENTARWRALPAAARVALCGVPWRRRAPLLLLRRRTRRTARSVAVGQ